MLSSHVPHLESFLQELYTRSTGLSAEPTSAQFSVLNQAVSVLSNQVSVLSQLHSALSQAVSVISQQVSALSQRLSGLSVIAGNFAISGTLSVGGTLSVSSALAVRGTAVNDLTIKQQSNTQATAGLAVVRTDTTARGVLFMGGDDSLYLFNFGTGNLELYANSTQIATILKPADILDGSVGFVILRNVAGVRTMQQVSMGAADSGGAGFKLLRVPN